jgi:hypothetical protein
MMNLTNRLGLCALAVCCVGTATSAQENGDSRKAKERDRASRYERDHDRGSDRDSYFERHGYTRLNIPKGHYPPPGECRIWYPDRPAGHQPPPVSCDRARADVAPGAWVIRHPDDDQEHVHVVVYDERRPRSILAIGQFNIATGVYVRVVVNR